VLLGPHHFAVSGPPVADFSFDYDTLRLVTPKQHDAPNSNVGHVRLLRTHAKTFAAFLAPLRKTRWFVYAKRPFAGPKAVLA
jgi:hypothetical protein